MTSVHVCFNTTVSQAIHNPYQLFRLDRERSSSSSSLSVRINGRGSPSACLSVESQVADTRNSAKSGLGVGERSSESVMKREGRVLVGTYARAPVVLARGKGCKLYDVEGREYLDMTSGIAVNALGHGDPDWLKAIVDQANLLAHVSNIYYSLPQVELAERLVACSFADRVFFSNSGTEANEAAIKFMINHVNPDVKELAMEFISFTNSFHGRTMGALALTNK